MNYNAYKLYKYLLMMHSVLRLKKGAISDLCFDFSNKRRFLWGNCETNIFTNFRVLCDVFSEKEIVCLNY